MSVVEVWSAIGVGVHPKGAEWSWGQGSVKDTQVLPHRGTPCLHEAVFVFSGTVMLGQFWNFQFQCSSQLRGNSLVKTHMSVTVRRPHTFGYFSLVSPKVQISISFCTDSCMMKCSLSSIPCLEFINKSHNYIPTTETSVC